MMNEELNQEFIDYSEKGLKEIVDIFQSLLEGDDVQKLCKEAEVLKACFYKNLRKEKIAAGYQAAVVDGTAGPEGAAETPAEEAEAASDTVSVNPFAEIERGFKELYGQYRAIRSRNAAELEKKREENYAAKLALIEELKVLLDAKEDLKDTFPAFRDIQARWREVGPVPQGKVKDLYDTYQHYVEMFYDYVKINREFRDLDFKKNLEAKIELCEKAEALVNEENVVEAFRTLQKYHEEWKELGPVDKENRESIWERFRAATAAVNRRHQTHFESMKGNQQENLEAKTALCEKVEALLGQEIKDSGTWNRLSKEIEDIQNEWRTIGFASKKDNQKIYDRFRKACNDFFTKKKAFYSGYKDQMQENLEKKIALCEEAESLQNSEDWKETTNRFIDLQKRWREIGPVSRKKSDQVWNRFRAACDAFFERRDKSGAGSPSRQYADNLAAKRALIAEVEAFEPLESREETVAALKAFQARWNEIGFVPFKEKDRVQHAFKAALDAQFDRMRGEIRTTRREAAVKDPVRSEREKLVQEYLQKEQEIATWSNNMGFFAKSKNADALLADMDKKIEAAKEELAALEAKIKEFDQKHEVVDEQ
ncbi:MAG: DUF349 domain-containing protein [Bacteroidales bacterium]|nr:DUF349 domain-containing protein [Bacteroidales bacterium]